MLEQMGKSSKKDNKKTPRKSLSLVLPLIAGIFTGIAAPPLAYTQKPVASKVSKRKTISLKHVKTTVSYANLFSAARVQDTRTNFSRDRLLKLSNGAYLFASAQIGKITGKTMFAVGVKPSGKSKPVWQYFDMKGLRRRYEKSGKRLKAWEIAFNKNNRGLVFYVIPLHALSGKPVSGVPVGIYIYNGKTGKTKEEGIKTAK